MLVPGMLVKHSNYHVLVKTPQPLFNLFPQKLSNGYNLMFKLLNNMEEIEVQIWSPELNKVIVKFCLLTGSCQHKNGNYGFYSWATCDQSLTAQFFILLNTYQARMRCMSCYGFFSVTVPRMYPFNPRLNFRVAYCLKLSGNWPLLYMKVMKVTK